jgi:hypothetical protein
LIAAALVISGCAEIRHVQVPDDVFQIRNEAVAFRVSGKPGEEKRDVRVPAGRLKDGDGYGEGFLLMRHEPGRLWLESLKVTGDRVTADLAAGSTYILMRKPGKRMAAVYDRLCRIARSIERPITRIYMERVCTQILCPGMQSKAGAFSPLPDGDFPPGGGPGPGEIIPGEFGPDPVGICEQCTSFRGPGVVVPSSECFVARATPAIEILFVSERDGNTEIYGIAADGSGLTNLTRNPDADFWPRWSPDGRRIAFVSTRDGNSEIYVMNADGSRQTRLTFDPANDTKPSWSADGGMILFTTNRSGRYETFAVYADPTSRTGWSAPVRLPQAPSVAPGYDFATSRDGGMFAVSAWTSGIVNSGTTDLHLFDRGGATWRNVSNTPAAYEGSPNWHPGERIAFMTSRDNDWEIYAMAADGSGATNLTQTRAFDDGPIWSPDGRKIAFITNRDGNWEVYAMNPDGSGATNLSNHTAADGSGIEAYLTWSPGSDQVAFQSNRDGDWNIHAVDLAGGTVRRLTDHPAADSFPQWRPPVR